MSEWTNSKRLRAHFGQRKSPGVDSSAMTPQLGQYHRPPILGGPIEGSRGHRTSVTKHSISRCSNSRASGICPRLHSKWPSTVLASCSPQLGQKSFILHLRNARHWSNRQAGVTWKTHTSPELSRLPQG